MVLLILSSQGFCSAQTQNSELLFKDTKGLAVQSEGGSDSTFRNRIYREHLNNNYFEECLLDISFGNAYLVRGKYDSATKYLISALEIAESRKYDSLRIDIYQSLGHTNKRQRNWPAAESYYKSALKIASTIDYPIALANITCSLGAYYWELYQRGEGIEDSLMLASKTYVDRCYQLNLALSEEKGMADCGLIMAALAGEESDYQKVSELTKRSLSTYRLLDDEISISACYTNLGVAFWNLEFKDSAELYFHKARVINEKLGLNQNQLALFQNLTEFYIDYGNKDSAQTYFARYQELNSSVEKIERDKNTKEIEEEYKLGLFQSERAAEQKQQRLRNRVNKIINASMFIGIIFLSIFLYNVFRSRRKIGREKRKADELLLNILPAKIAEELKMNGSAKPRYYEEVSILFADIENFTRISSELEATAIIDMLDEYFSIFDDVFGLKEIEKVKTIGDAYMAVSGIPDGDPEHAFHMVDAALSLQDKISRLNAEKIKEGSRTFRFRIGINSGAVVAGIVGRKKFQYDIWGDAVNMAARMEQASLPGQVNVSVNTYKLVANSFKFVHRGKIPAKNKGEIDMYFVYSNNSLNVTEQKFEQFIEEITSFLRNQLDHRLFYHGFHHTMYVLKVAEEIALYEGVGERDLLLLKTAVLLHDSGFSKVYNGHEEEGCRIADKMLPPYGYTPDDIAIIKGMIMATKIPQQPTNLLENIIADADLEYLGTDNFEQTSNTLFEEWNAYDILHEQDAWMKAQIGFISKHSYFTEFCKKYRTEKKTENLNSLKDHS